MPEITWTLSAAPKRKAKYAAKQRVKDDMTESQKKGVATWNEMVMILQENGLMEDKPE